MKYTHDQLCNFFGCSPEQLKKQYEANADILKKMADKSLKTGKKVNGFTASQLSDYHKKYDTLSK